MQVLCKIVIDGPANAPERALLPDRGASTLTNWYLGNPHHVEQFKTSDGKVLRDSAVQNLVPSHWRPTTQRR
ncbi:MAG: hypothetical protein IPG23_03930 [Burkholderiales bacterium]|nr:hypothetical protein [Burkholderiales bacterium]